MGPDAFSPLATPLGLGEHNNYCKKKKIVQKVEGIKITLITYRVKVKETWYLLPKSEALHSYLRKAKLENSDP